MSKASWKVAYKFVIAIGCFWISLNAFGVNLEALPTWRVMAGVMAGLVAIEYLGDAEDILDDEAQKPSHIGDNHD